MNAVEFRFSAWDHYRFVDTTTLNLKMKIVLVMSQWTNFTSVLSKYYSSCGIWTYCNVYLSNPIFVFSGNSYFCAYVAVQVSGMLFHRISVLYIVYTFQLKYAVTEHVRLQLGNPYYNELNISCSIFLSDLLKLNVKNRLKLILFQYMTLY